MHFLSVFSLKNRALIALVTIVVAVFGGISLTLLKQELMPSITLPQLYVVTTYPGASPEVVEHDVSTPIENAIQSIPGLKDTTATSNENFSNVTAEFDFGTNLSQAEEKITTAINRIKSTLPDGTDPQVIQFSLSDFPIIQLAVTSDLDAATLSDRLDRLVVPELSRLDGVASADLSGTEVQEVDITPDTAKLAAHGLTTQSIQTALSQNGVLIPGGSITADGETLNVQTGVRLGSADDIAALPLIGGATANAPGATPEVVTIGDVATVRVADQAVTGYSRVDGKDALTLSVTKTSTGNTVAVSKEVTDKVAELAGDLGGNTAFTTVFDQAPFITQSIESLTQEGLLGLVFAVIVILIFLLSIRSTLVTAVSIPTSVLITFIGMWASGYTLNIITLGGLTIAIGRVVDDSIVVIENIKRHLELGEEKRAAILKAVREVAGAVTASTITTVAVFLPIGLVGDEVGELFRPFAITVGIALFASLFVALTIVPVLAYWFLGRPNSAKRKAAKSVDAAAGTGAVGTVVAEERPSALQRGYLPIIRWTLKYPAVVIMLAILVLGGSLALVPRLQLNFIGDSGQNTVTVTEDFDAGTSLDDQDAAAKRVEQALMGVDGVTTVQTTVGSSGSGLAAAFSSGSSASFSLTTDPDADQTAVQDAIRSAIAGIQDAGDLALSSSNGFGSSTVDITVRAAAQEDLEAAVKAVEDGVRGLDSVGDVTDNIAASLPYIGVTVDRDKAAEHGLTEAQVGGLIMATMSPSSIGDVNIDDRTLSVVIKDDAAPTTLQELQDFTIPTATGPVALADLATIERTLGPASVTTNQGIRTAVVSLKPASEDVGATTFAVQAALASLELPSGASVELGGVSSQMLDSFSQLGLALLAAILIVYVVMVATFKSLRQPLLLLVSVPFAASGAILLQVATGIPLGVSSLIGVLMLVGIVVTNAIVLVDLVNQYRAAGMDARTAVEQGASRRLRPILMTAAATIFALVPLATGLTGHGGGFISQPLAIIVIGGLVSSTVLTLVVLPSLYYLVEGRKERRAPKLAAKAERKAAKAAERAEAERIVAERAAAAAAARAEQERVKAEAVAAKLAELEAARARKAEAKAAKRPGPRGGEAAAAGAAAADALLAAEGTPEAGAGEPAPSADAVAAAGPAPVAPVPAGQAEESAVAVPPIPSSVLPSVAAVADGAPAAGGVATTEGAVTADGAADPGTAASDAPILPSGPAPLPGIVPAAPLPPAAEPAPSAVAAPVPAPSAPVDPLDALAAAAAALAAERESGPAEPGSPAPGEPLPDQPSFAPSSTAFQRFDLGAPAAPAEPVAGQPAWGGPAEQSILNGWTAADAPIPAAPADDWAAAIQAIANPTPSVSAPLATPGPATPESAAPGSAIPEPGSAAAPFVPPVPEAAVPLAAPVPSAVPVPPAAAPAYEVPEEAETTAPVLPPHSPVPPAPSPASSFAPPAFPAAPVPTLPPFAPEGAQELPPPMPAPSMPSGLVVPPLPPQASDAGAQAEPEPPEEERP